MYPRIKKTAEASIRIHDREEQPFAENPGGPQLSKARYRVVYEGGIEGKGIVEELKVQFSRRSAVMTGMQHLEVCIGGLRGLFTTHYQGTFRDGKVSHSHVVVPGSATGQLKGLRGKIKLYSPEAEVLPVTFRYYLL